MVWAGTPVHACHSRALSPPWHRYPHVTFFFNGGIEDPLVGVLPPCCCVAALCLLKVSAEHVRDLAGEERILVP